MSETDPLRPGQKRMHRPRGESPEHGRVMPDPATQTLFAAKDDGYRGMWHGQTWLGGEYVWKYSGGLGTYCAKHRPLAIYAAEVHRTFFCWGGTTRDSYKTLTGRHENFEPGQLLHMVSYFDHATKTVPQPTIIFDKHCADPHDNPVLSIDADGHLWLFSPSHGNWTTRSFIHRSMRPYDIDAWETVSDGPLFAYPQPWCAREAGFLFCHTAYADGRGLSFKRSRDGRTWTQPQPIAFIEKGHYQITAFDEQRGLLGAAFNFHPTEGGLEKRTNLYYIETRDFGETWTNIHGQPLELPLTTIDNPALAVDDRAAGRLVYLKDIDFDAAGRPVIVTLTSRDHEPGPQGGPHRWRVTRWDGEGWQTHAITDSDNNYDMGSLYLEGQTWRLIAPTQPGPQPYNPGGEAAVWLSRDRGETWSMHRQLTSGSECNHTYIRRPLHAHPDFYAFWADGNPRQPSASRLYFTDRDGSAVWQLPTRMDGETATPQRAW